MGKGYIHPTDDRYGPRVGGHRYKKFIPPEPLAVTILKVAAVSLAVLSSPPLLLNAIRAYLKYKTDEAKYFEYLDKKRIQRSLEYLKRKHFIAFPGKGRFTITAKGKSRLEKVKLDKIKIPRLKTWDRKWRLLTFDIPEEKTHLRDYFRRRLKEIGFYHFQRSVFIFPYPCVQEIDTICETLGITVSVHVLVADRFEGDYDLIKHFRLDT